VPDPRALLIAIGVGGGVAGYTLLWWHWPLAIGVGAGILLGGLALTGTISVRPEGSSADAAWRAAAPDLQEPPAGPLPGVPISHPGPGAPADPGPTVPGVPRGVPPGVQPTRVHDLPSGD
jgi:hypothetical protein